MNLEVITPPPVEPVTLAEVWAFLRLDPYPAVQADPEAIPPVLAADAYTDFDSTLTRLIQAAREQVETDTRRALVRQRIRLTTDGFGLRLVWSRWGGVDFRNAQPIELLRPPFIELETVAYYDEANVLRTLYDVATDPPVSPPPCYVSASSLVSRLEFPDPFDICTYRRDDAVQVVYWAGFPYTPAIGETPADYTSMVPAVLKRAIMVHVQMHFDTLAPADFQVLQNAYSSLTGPFEVKTL